MIYRKLTQIAAHWSIRFALLPVIVWFAAALVFRLNMADFGQIIPLLILAVASAIFGLGVNLVAFISIPSARIKTACGIALTAALIILPLNAWMVARKVPPIHDISTDLINPPRYVETLKMRAASDNSLAANPNTQNFQRAYYKNIKTQIINRPPPTVFAQALLLATSMGWEIISTNSKLGHIEAVDISQIFGFKDDIVLRILPHETSSKVDMRSASRVGISDLGVNAKRVTQFLNNLKNYSAEAE